MNKRRPLSEIEAADAARLKALVDRDPRAQLEIAFACGWKTQGAVSQYTLGNIPLGLDAANRFARVLGCNLIDISPRLAAKAASISNALSPISAVSEPQDYQDYDGVLTKEELREAVMLYRGERDRTTAFIRQLDVRASMGTGTGLQEHVDVVRMIRVSLPDLRRVLPSFSSPQNLTIVTGLGDSMLGTFSDGDPIVVDTGVTDVRVDGCYVFERGRELFIKRVQRQLDGSLLIISDNQRYKPQIIDDGNRSQFRVIGRALGVWNFQKL